MKRPRDNEITPLTGDGETMKVVLPLPNPVLSPNRPCGSAGGRMKRAAASRRYRKLAYQSALAESLESTPWAKAEGKAVFFHKQDRRRDGPNYNAMLKAAIDGIVDAGIITDDDYRSFSLLPPDFRIDKDFPRVEISLRRLD